MLQVLLGALLVELQFSHFMMEFLRVRGWLYAVQFHFMVFYLSIYLNILLMYLVKRQQTMVNE